MRTKFLLTAVCIFCSTYSFAEELFDVVVVGGGAAGLAAAVSAAENGSKVILLEKGLRVGGNAYFSGGYYNAVDPELQKKAGIQDSEELFVKQMLESGAGKNDPEIVKTMVKEALPTLNWLKSKGLKFQEGITESFGGEWRRSFKPISPDGQGYIQVLLNDALKRNVEIRTSAAVQEITRDNKGKVRQVRYLDKKNERQTVEARKGIILAAGGFGANLELVGKISPDLGTLGTDNFVKNTGEVMLSAQKIGAKLVNLEEIECLPGAREEGATRSRLHGDTSRFILIDAKGKRFIREDASRSQIRDAVLRLPKKMAFILVDSEGLRSYSKLVQRDTIRSIEAGDVIMGDTLEEIAEKMNIPAESLKRTVTAYNESVVNQFDPLGKDPKKLIHSLKTPPFYIGFAPMAIHNTLGGLAIDTRARVLDEKGSPILGLYAAGEITGLTHGANRLGGNGLTEALTFGRLAGKNCSQND